MNIAVIGGGVMGLSCSWRLAQAGAKVTLFEARACGEGATLASLGALWPASPLFRGPLQELHRESLWQFDSFAQELAANSGLPVDFRRLGRLEFLEDKKVARAREEAAAAASQWPSFAAPRPPMQILSADQIVGAHPALAPQQKSALMCRVTAQVNVNQLVGALRAACIHAGVVVREKTPVERVDFHGDRAMRLCLKEGIVPVETVLLTAGAWMCSIGESAANAARIAPVKGQAMRLELPAGVRLDCIVKSGPIYLVPWDDQVLLGATTEPAAGYDESFTAAARESLLAGATAIVPQLADARILREWAGLRPRNAEKPHHPVMGQHPEIANLYLCAGHYKTGIGMAPLVAKLMTDRITTGTAPRLAPFFPKLQP